MVNFGGKGKYSDPEFVWTRVVAPTAIEFLNSARLGTQYQNDMFVADFNYGRIYNFNLNSQRTALVLTGVLSDRIANTDAETQSVIFGEGFGGISDLKVGTGDGYLYILSLGAGALYRILPSAAVTSFADDFKGQEGGEEQNENQLTKPFIMPDEQLDRGLPENDVSDENVNDDRLACENLDDRLDQIEEQENRGGLDEEQAGELRQRIESIQKNLDC